MPLSHIAASDIVETAPSPLIVLDQNLNITSADRAFYQTFRTNPDETEGLTDYGNAAMMPIEFRTEPRLVKPFDHAKLAGLVAEHFRRHGTR